MGQPQRVGQGGNFHRNFSGNDDSTCPSTVSDFGFVDVGVAGTIVLMSPGPVFYFPPTGPAAPANPSPAGTFSPHDAGGSLALEDVPRDVVPSDARPAGGGAGTDTGGPIGSVVGGGIVPTTVPGGDSGPQVPGQSPASAGGGPGPDDLRPHLVSVDGGTTGGAPDRFFWSVVFCVSCGLFLSLCMSMLCSWCGASEDEGKGGSGV